MSGVSFEQFRSEFFKLVSGADQVAITSHISPDDDSIASVLSVFFILSERFPGKNIRILYTGEPVVRYAGFKNFEKIEWVDDVANHFAGADLLIMLDASQYQRFSKKPEALQAVPKTIAIDHHASTPENFSLLLHRNEFSSNAELVYRALIDDQGELAKPLAELFLLGILGDTGNFLYVNPSQSEVFLIAKRLLEIIGIPIAEFRSRYGMMPKRAFELIQVLMKNTHYGSVSGWPDTQYAFIDRRIADSGNYTDEEMSAASHLYLGSYLPRITGYEWGFVITPRTDGTCRMSSRSLPSGVNVRIFHEQLGVGGGHDRAAGGSFSKMEPAECIAEILEWMKHHKPTLG